MKRIVVLFLSLIWIIFPAISQSSKYICRLGFTFEISQQPAWGYNKPVILSILPYSSANGAGLQPGDIIEEINGIKTEGSSLTSIHEIINNASGDIRLTVNSLKGTHEVTLYKDCKHPNSITEAQLAEAYSFYSLEDVAIRSFSCPFKTVINPAGNLLNYKSFGFSAIDQSNQQLENLIYREIRNCLEAKGLVYDEKNPDLLVNTYYSYNKNPNYTRTDNADKFKTETRYNVHAKKMENLPIYYNALINPKQAEFLLNLGIRLIDRKKSEQNNLLVVWECSADELLQSNFTLDNYAKIHIPLMFMQFPYPKTTEFAQFKYKKMKYNYTGISYNIDKLKEITEVDRTSPAAKADVMAGDIAEKINGIKPGNDAKVMSEAYKQFIYQTMSLRDPKTQYTNAEGFTKCMYWDPFKYPQVNEAFKKPEHFTVFSYLFYFQPYINNMSGSNVVSLDIKRGNEKINIKINPIPRMEESFETY